MTATLVGDVGGTNARFALAERTAQGSLELHHSERLAVAEFGSFDDAVASYLDAVGVKPKKAAFAFAGPKFDGEIRMTNAPWTVSESQLSGAFGFDALMLVNDFVAMANGATVIPDDGFQTLIEGKVNYNKPVVVTGPGTGLGVSLILPRPAPGLPRTIVPTEGGHTGFTPQTEEERAVLLYWQERMDFVAAESLISGPGLFRLYTALCDIRGEKRRATKPDEIVAAAQASPKTLARATVVTFCNMLGTFAANTACTTGAAGGVVIGGGVAKHVAPFMAESDFAARFQARGTSSFYVADIPVRLIKANFVALYGAADMVMEQSA